MYDRPLIYFQTQNLFRIYLLSISNRWGGSQPQQLAPTISPNNSRNIPIPYLQPDSHVTPIQIFYFLSFFFQNLAPTAPMVPPRGVACSSNPQYFCPPNIFSEHTYALSPPHGGASIRTFYT